MWNGTSNTTSSSVPDRSTRNPRLLVTSGVARLCPDALASFAAAGFELVCDYELSGSRDERAVTAALDGIWGVLAGTEGYTASVLANAPQLRAIARCGVGFDSIDLTAAHRHGVTVITTPGTNGEAVAEYALGMMLVQTVLGDNPATLTGKTVAIIGLGEIGSAVARRLAGFGCRMLAVDPVADPTVCEQLGVELATLHAALSLANIVTIHAPLEESTRNMIGPAELALMRSDSLLVNTARGGLVDEDALADALQARRIRAAALDAFAEEPLPAHHPLRRTPATLLTGHVAGMTATSARAMLNRALEGLLDVRAHASAVRGALTRNGRAPGGPAPTTRQVLA